MTHTVEIKKHMDLLGFKVKDKVTGFKGVISSISFDLYGCVQAIVTPVTSKGNDQKESRWYDIKRLEVTSKKPVMDPPDFYEGYIATGKKGAAEKPLP